MSTVYKPYTINELIDAIYEDNIVHFNSSLDDCDCNIHLTIKMIIGYLGE